MKTIALVTAREGSKGLPGKNMLSFKGIPLVCNAVVEAVHSRSIDEIYISTDSKEIELACIKFGAKSLGLRPKDLALDDTPDIDVLRHFADSLGLSNTSEFIVHLRPTSPQRTSILLDTAINEIKSNNIYTSLRTFHRVSGKDLKLSALRCDGRLYAEAIGQRYVADMVWGTARQSLPDLIAGNGLIDILRSDLIHSENYFGERVAPFLTSFSHDIDTQDDYEDACSAEPISHGMLIVDDNHGIASRGDLL